MLDKSLAARYARAFYRVGCAQKNDAELLAQLRDMQAAIEGNVPLRKMLYHPGIPAEEKKKLVAGLFTGAGFALALRCLQSLLSAKRIQYLGMVCDSFEELHNQQRERTVVQVETRYPLSSDVQQRLAGSLKHYLDKQEVDVVVKTEPSILGGLRLMIGQSVIDGSILHRLRKLEQRLVMG